MRAQGKDGIHYAAAVRRLPPPPSARRTRPDAARGRRRDGSRPRQGAPPEEERDRRQGVHPQEPPLYPALGHLPLDRITTEQVAKLSRGPRQVKPQDAREHPGRPRPSFFAPPSIGTCSRPCPARSRSRRRLAHAAGLLRAGADGRLVNAAAARFAHAGADPARAPRRPAPVGDPRARLGGRERPAPSARGPTRRDLQVRRHPEERPRTRDRSLRRAHGRFTPPSADVTEDQDSVLLQNNSKPALARHLYAWTREAMARAGIPRKKGVALHVMRHSAGPAVAAIGVPTSSPSRLLPGHESMHTTEKYMHLAPGALRAGRCGLALRSGPG